MMEENMKDIRKVVIPVAGWGTRSLPATKNIPKEMLPIYNKPVIQYVVEEAQRAHIKDVIFVTNRDKNVIEDHFDHNLQLEDLLERSGKLDKLEEVRRVAEMVNILSVRQKRQLGLGHAVLCARELVGDEPFAVMVGDGCCAFVSMALGRNEVDKAKRSVGNAVVLSIASSLVLTVVYLIFANSIASLSVDHNNIQFFCPGKCFFSAGRCIKQHKSCSRAI